MTIKEKLLQEFECAINAIYGDRAEEEFSDEEVGEADLIAIAQKVAFYLDK